MDRDLAVLQEKTEIINRKRKQTQEESVDKLYATQYQALEMQMKNYHIQVREQQFYAFWVLSFEFW